MQLRWQISSSVQAGVARTGTRARPSAFFVLALCAWQVAIFLAANEAVAADAAGPQRIVSLSPHATELLFAAGAGRNVVGVTESCDRPAAVKRLPKISGFRGANVEAVIALKPDLVVTWPSGNRSADVDAIRRYGIPIHASELATLASITAELRLFSQWATTAELRNAALARAYDADRLIQALRGRYATARKVKVFYQLGAGRLFTLTDKHAPAIGIAGATVELHVLDKVVGVLIVRLSAEGFTPNVIEGLAERGITGGSIDGSVFCPGAAVAVDGGEGEGFIEIQAAVVGTGDSAYVAEGHGDVFARNR